MVARHEWFSGEDQLGPEGREHVNALADALPYNEHPVVLESEPVALLGDETYDEALTRTAELNESRRHSVIARLAGQGVSDASERVILSPLDRVGVRGAEAPRIYNQMISGFGGLGRGRGGQFGNGGGGGGFGGLGGGGGFGGGFGGGGFF